MTEFGQEKKSNLDVEETPCNSGWTPYSTISGDTALGRLIFLVAGEVYKAQESPWGYLCSDSPKTEIHFVSSPSREEMELQSEFDAWDAASDETHQDFAE